MPFLQFKGKTAVETYHHSLPHHALELDAASSVLAVGQTPSLDGNLIIEGDNLLALKSLLPTHAGRIKCIYIDPPYNTGNEGWVYNDNLNQPQFKEWIGQTVGKEGEDACRHDKWCCMMYPRLQLLRELLRDDGVIFVSIDDNEVANLRLIMEEIFGVEHFVAMIVAQTNPRGRTLDKFIAKTHEYIVVFTKGADEDALSKISKSEEALEAYDKNDDKGKYRLLELRNRNPVFNKLNRPNLYYPIFVDPDTNTVSLVHDENHSVGVYPLNSQAEEGCWTWGQTKVLNNTHLLVGRQVNTGAWRIFRKDYLPEEGATTKAKSLWIESVINNENGKEEVGRLFNKAVFDFPKSVELIKKCLTIGTSGDDEEIVLDSFAGSGTTGQAVLELNSADGGNRKFILVQQPYEPNKTSTNQTNITQKVTAERVRLVINSNKIGGGKGEFAYARVSDRPLFGEYRDMGENLPAYEELAKYIFYTETSRDWNPAGMNPATGKIGELGGTSYYLLYKATMDDDWGMDTDFLKHTAAADPNKNLVVYHEKFLMHRENLRKWEQENHKRVRSMLVPFNIR